MSSLYLARFTPIWKNKHNLLLEVLSSRLDTFGFEHLQAWCRKVPSICVPAPPLEVDRDRWTGGGNWNDYLGGLSSYMIPLLRSAEVNEA